MRDIGDYYQREGHTAPDGSPMFQEEADRSLEAAVAEKLCVAWDCEVAPFGMLAPLDYFATRHGRMKSVIEIKCRTHGEDQYETVFLNVRKWLALGLAQVGMGVPGIFVVQFTSGIRYIRWDDIDGRMVSMAGCSRVVKARSDIEPVISVPLIRMKEV